MYIPPAFRIDNIAQLHGFMQRHSFATVVSSAQEGLQASHLPLLLNREAGQFGQLIGHMAKANDQWKSAVDQEVLVVFSGPHAYVSPSWYPDDKVVPTWNYTAVHVYGRFRLEDDADRLLEIVNDYVREYESTMPQPWSLDSQNEEFVCNLTNAIVGFSIDIDRIEGKWKLNQNHSTERQNGVIAGLRERNRGHDSAIAQLMQKQLNDG